MAQKAPILLRVPITTPYIKLGQFLKFLNVVSAGGITKSFLEQNIILVNGVADQRRGRKLYHGDVVSFQGKKYVIVGGNSVTGTTKE